MNESIKNSLNTEPTLEAYRINPQEDVERPPVAIMINSEGGPTPSFTLGNFSMVIGKAKSKKTFLIGALAAAAIKGDYTIDVVQGTLPADKRKVLYFDTEQGRYHATRSIKRIAQLSCIENPGNLLAYGLRRCKPERRLKLIEEAIYRISGIGLIIIDGGRDLLSLGINDEKQATEVTSDFLRWTEERMVHIIVVLHQNKNDTNARGHFGTECINKAETTLRVTQSGGDPNISFVKCEFARDKLFKTFAFRINDDGIPESVYASQTFNSCQRVTSADQIDDLQHKEVIASVFDDDQHFTYTPLWQSIKAELGNLDIKIGDNTAKDFLKYYQNKNWIIKDQKGSYITGSIDEV